MTAAAPALQALDGVLAKAPAENFPVALWFLPKQLRADLLAIYGYARFVDDIGDESSVEPSVRLAVLDLVDADVTTLFAGGDASMPAVAALTAGVRAGRVPETPLRRSSTPTGSINAPTATRRSTTYGTTARCRPTRSGTWCLRPSASRRLIASNSPTRSALPCSWLSIGRTSRRISTVAASTFHKRIFAGSLSATTTCAPRTPAQR